MISSCTFPVAKTLLSEVLRMTRRLARLADIAYRRRGRMAIAWIVATVVIIGLGTALAGEYEADYNTPGSDSKAASDLTEREFGGYSGQEIYVVWKDPAGVTSPASKQKMDAFFKQTDAIKDVEKRDAIRVSDDGTIATTTLPLTIPGWQVKKEQ